MKNIIRLIVLATAVLLAGCEKEIFSAPETQTIKVEVLSTTSASFRANISSLGTDQIVDHGFLYGYTADLNEANSEKISLGKEVVLGEFSTNVDDLIPNTSRNYTDRIFVKSYVKDQRGTVYGSTITAMLPVPTAGRITPAQASAGDTVRISGKFFSPNILRTGVVIGDKSAAVVSASDTLITAVVPSGISGSHGSNVPVVINLGGTSTSNYQGITVIARFTDFMPKTGPVGTVVTLQGDNLPQYYSSNMGLTVKLGAENLSLNWDSKFSVPFSAAIESPLTITMNGRVHELPGKFTVTPPEIVSFGSNAVFAGRQAIIQLNSSAIASPNTNVGRPQVKIGSGSYIDVSWYNREVIFTVPTNTPEGDHTVYFKVGPHEIQSPTKLKVVGYSVTSFKPAVGAVGTSVEITGTFIAGEYYTVYFGSRGVSGYAKSSSIVTAEVPSGVDLGKLKISVQTSSGRISVPGEMEILGPSLTSVSPLSGVPGTKITIRGSGFSASSWNNYVSFGWNYVTPEVIDGNTMVVYVPSNIGRGGMTLSVVIDGQTLTYKDNFTIL
ncbi:IPT/TIG domain-containing protein [Sphingobacterium sp. lm-10]|uniref:IPT/TIG domain-containing protein n=1 Tax=Sphingobacterium sp. lm-10 TaxID=2944904 RepID=UPI002022485D|nr:IPT/TIG domain-containing protein [Sphingobacterium sp. lm-10]MCL7987926.1 IPT/TIG domain-containing protein [Sphingobacterium sp. lm-10]